MLTVIAEIRTRPGQHHRQAVLDQFAKIVPTVLKEEGCHGYAPMVTRLGIGDEFVEQGTVAELKAQCGYDAEGIYQELTKGL
mgnify:CR=1 FL=1